MRGQRNATNAAASARLDDPPPPHGELYTRLQVGGDGIGVFAIRDIPAGTALFAGDTGKTTQVSAQKVEKIKDQEIRQMYLDFCPVIDGAYVAPLDFNQLTMGWYLNHSDNPNVVGGRDLVFKANRLITKGEELLVDYTTFSEHAHFHVKSWTGVRANAEPTKAKP